MKKILLVLTILLALSLACSRLTGGGNGEDPTNLTTPEGGSDSGNSGENTTFGDAAGDTGGEADSEPPASDSACYNPFYPLAEGGTLFYRVATVVNLSTEPGADDYFYYEFRTVETTEDTMTVQLIFDEFNTEVKWLCGEDGLFSSEYAQFNFQHLADIEIETVGYSGVTLPTEEDWFVGNTWTVTYEINMSYSVQGIEVESHVIGDIANEIVGIETVSTPAGDFDEAFVVEMTGTIDIDSDMGGAQLSMGIPITMTSWYVKGVGMVKQVSMDETGYTITELVENN